MPTRKQVHFRDSDDGRFATKREADQSPKTHEREVIKHPAPAPKKK